MEINNAIYETMGHTWWQEDAGFEVSSLRYCINPVRYAYFRERLRELSVPGKSVLDIGCGGGFLTEEFARDGFDVTGLDPAANSVKAARAHAEQNHLPIRYCEGRGESLPFADDSFAVVTCCDVLEHVDDVAQVIREVSRTLRPGGVFLFDTVNRTVMSWLVLIKLWQDWGWAGIPANVHVWDKFIKPNELVALMQDNGLLSKGLKGIGPVLEGLAARRGQSGHVEHQQLASDFIGRQDHVPHLAPPANRTNSAGVMIRRPREARFGKWRKFPVTRGTLSTRAHSANAASSGSGRFTISPGPTSTQIARDRIAASTSSTSAGRSPKVGRTKTSAYSAKTRSSTTATTEPARSQSTIRPGGPDGERKPDTTTLVSNTARIIDVFHALRGRLQSLARCPACP